MERHARDRTVELAQSEQCVGGREITTMQLDAIRPRRESRPGANEHRFGDVDPDEANPGMGIEHLRRLIAPSDPEFQDPGLGIPLQLQPVDPPPVSTAPLRSGSLLFPDPGVDVLVVHPRVFVRKTPRRSQQTLPQRFAPSRNPDRIATTRSRRRRIRTPPIGPVPGPGPVRTHRDAWRTRRSPPRMGDRATRDATRPGPMRESAVAGEQRRPRRRLRSGRDDSSDVVDSAEMKVRLLDHHIIRRRVHTRLPFKFGVHVLRSVPLAELRIEVESVDGRRASGLASDLLVPKWFEKNPDTTPDADSTALAESVERAVDVARRATDAAGAHPVFDIAEITRFERVGSSDHRDADVLVRGFGVAMVERALIDAVCRLASSSFHEAVTEDLLGFQAHRLIPETNGWSPASLPSPATSIAVRHTVGMLDPLTDAEIPEAERVEDGLPQSLESAIDAYGMRRFKVKIGDDHAANAARLRAIAAVVEDRVEGEPVFTLDGNEQCEDLEALAGMLESLGRDPSTAPLIDRLALVEQPLPRRDTFDESRRAGIARVGRIAPVVIDEADADRDAFRRALDLGYAGVSVKACKGVFRALANRGLVEVRRAGGDGRCFQSGEDLTNLGSIPLQQDLALQATIGVADVERNGHHYFRGLAHLPDAAANRLVDELPTLYTGAGGPTRLRIDDGRLDLRGVVDGVGFGGFLGSLDSTD